MNHSNRHPHQNVISSPFMGSPFVGFHLMDNLLGMDQRDGGHHQVGFHSGFSSLSTFNGSNGFGGGGGMKRTSTSTTFAHGKKIVTKR